MKRFLQPVRLGVFVLLVFAAAAAGPAAAMADPISSPIEGTATGMTIPLGNGTFRIVGTFTDASTPGIAGTYVGTYVEDTTGYTSCFSLSIGGQVLCALFPELARCNIIHGSVTIRSRGETNTFFIGGDFFLQGRLLSVVCLNRTNPEVHDVDLFLTAVDPTPIPVATGSMVGTSTPAQGGTYEDVFSLRVIPCSCT